MSLSHEDVGLKILAKIKSYMYPQQSQIMYLLQFEMRYPVLHSETSSNRAYIAEIYYYDPNLPE